MLFQTCVLTGKFSLNIKSTGIHFVVQYRICPGVTFGLLVSWEEFVSCKVRANETSLEAKRQFIDRNKDINVAYATTLFTPPNQLINNISFFLPHICLANTLEYQAMHFPMCTWTIHMFNIFCVQFFCVSYFWKSFALQNLILCITDSEKCNISGGI